MAQSGANAVNLGSKNQFRYTNSAGNKTNRAQNKPALIDCYLV
jgi:hypothetical protein